MPGTTAPALARTDRPRPLPEPVAVRTSDDALRVELSDGRTVSAPLAWYPRLVLGTPE